jgi:hypothetical protein
MASNHHALEFLSIIIQLHVYLTETVRNVGGVHYWVPEAVQNKYREPLIRPVVEALPLAVELFQ